MELEARRALEENRKGGGPFSQDIPDGKARRANIGPRNGDTAHQPEGRAIRTVARGRDGGSALSELPFQALAK